MNKLICTHFNIDEPDKLLLELPDLERIKAAGYDGIRQDLGWSAIERPAKRYDLRAVDTLVKALQKQGLTAIFILCYGNNHVYQGDPSGHTGPIDLEHQMAFVDYARLLMTTYAGRGFQWEIWNEPDHPNFWLPKPNYDAWVMLAYEVAAMAYNCCRGEALIGPALSTTPGTDGAINMDWLQKLTGDPNLVKKLKGISVHAHRHRPPETIIAEIAEVKKLFPKKKIIVSEWGYPFNWLMHIDIPSRLDVQRKQADHLRRSFAAAEKAGASAMAYYSWSERDGDPLGWGIKGTRAEKALV